MTRVRRKVGRRLRGGALMLIAALMIGSAMLRFGIAAAPALAREAETVGQEKPGPARDAPDDAGAATTPAELQQLLAALLARKADLDARDVQIEDRMRALAVADTAVERKLRALTEAEDRLKATLALADGAAEGDLTRLTNVYEKMKPKESAALFAEMAPEFAAGFLGRMRPEVAAGILAGMDPPAAYAISVVLAGRNTGVPKE